VSHFTPLASAAGGVLLGVASSLLLLFNGRICGISGIIGGLPAAPHGDRAWRVAFFAGLLCGGGAFVLFDRGALALASEQTTGMALLAGVLVGAGTRLGNGCTSGHGLCGIARLSKRSIVATMVFMATGAATVFVTRHVLGGAAS
jgi:uncharacterized membrane protein YedE/YeeE